MSHHPTQATTSLLLTPETTPAELQLDTSAFGLAADRYHWMNEHELLGQTRAQEQGGALGWVERNVLAQEVIQFKGVALGGSIITAIKRKNPFALISPIIFWAAW